MIRETEVGTIIDLDRLRKLPECQEFLRGMFENISGQENGKVIIPARGRLISVELSLENMTFESFYELCTQFPCLIMKAETGETAVTVSFIPF